MRDIAKSYNMSGEGKPSIDGVEFPWAIAAEGPMVEPASEYHHILWLPIIVMAPMPTPPQGRPDGTPIAAAREADRKARAGESEEVA